MSAKYYMDNLHELKGLINRLSKLDFLAKGELIEEYEAFAVLSINHDSDALTDRINKITDRLKWDTYYKDQQEVYWGVLDTLKADKTNYQWRHLQGSLRDLCPCRSCLADSSIDPKEAYNILVKLTKVAKDLLDVRRCVISLEKKA